MPNRPLSPLSNGELQAFSSQMAMILKSGISTTEGILILLDDSHDQAEQIFLKAILDTLNQTGNFYESLKETDTCPDYFLSMVQIGEQTGNLDEVMAMLADYYEKEDNLSQTIRTAVSYPLLMIIMMIAVIVILITKVMPIFNQVFQQFGSSMTGISRGFLNMGIFLNQHAIPFIILMVLLAAACFYLFRTVNGQTHLRRMLAHFKSIRALHEKISARRFADGMSLTLGSGLTPKDAVSFSLQLIDPSDFRSRLEQCEAAVSDGMDLCEALTQYHIFPGLYARIASIGFRTGSTEEAMKKIADSCESEIDEQINSLVACIEPTLVIILSVLVGVILLSVMLPLVSLMSSL